MPSQAVTSTNDLDSRIETAVETIYAPSAIVNVPVEQAAPASNALSIHDYITVRNGFNGKLVYKSKRTGETYVWDGFGSEQEMELQELKNAKNSSKEFFENNWFMFEDQEVVRYLGVERYYKSSLSVGEIDRLFKKTPQEIRKTVSALSAGQRETLVQRARYLIRNDEVDSIKVIQTLEDVLGVKLLER